MRAVERAFWGVSLSVMLALHNRAVTLKESLSRSLSLALNFLGCCLCASSLYQFYAFCSLLLPDQGMLCMGFSNIMLHHSL